MKRLLACFLCVVLILAIALVPVAAQSGSNKLPHPGPVPTPEVMVCGDTSVNLVMHYGCEYRVNGGEWQPLAGFYNLTPDTEYTFELRWKETDYYQASAVSEPLVVRTKKTGPSSMLNHTALLEYIEANGITDEQNHKTLYYMIQDEYGADYYFLLTKGGYFATLELFYDASAVTGLAFDLKFDLLKNTDSFLLKCVTYLVDNDTIIDEADYNTRINLLDLDADYTFVTGRSSDYFTAEDLSTITDFGLKLLLVFWDEMIYSELGFGLKGLGFTSFDGQGETYCNPTTGYHTGQMEVLYQRDPTCSTYGCTGYEYCTTCHCRASDTEDIPYVEIHTYDYDCDAICNHCGFPRNVRHRYAAGCARNCTICGNPREETYAKHTIGQDGLCRLCGEPGRIPGDISGDGKVNMGDVAKLYAHTRGTSLITDPEALVAADVTGDSKINLGDTARLLAHITGKNPLF